MQINTSSGCYRIKCFCPGTDSFVLLINLEYREKMEQAQRRMEDAKAY